MPAAIDRAGVMPRHQATSLPRRAVRAFFRRVSHARRRAWDRKHPTTLSESQFAAALTAGGTSSPAERPLDLRAFQLGPIAPPPGASAGYRLVAASSVRHVFDLLGSGPVGVNYETRAAGAFGFKYEMRPGLVAERMQVACMREALDRTAEFLGEQSPSLDLYRAALHAGAGTYRPVDWHLDFKSGYRWDPSIWYMDTPVGHAPGVDVKVPWELSRCHHLVALALDGATGGPLERTSDELGLQVLDWISANPVRFGVNWRSAMDAAIRAANWLRAIAIAGGEQALPRSIMWMAAKSLYEHGLHVASHLDYENLGTNNHYLAEVAGLLHIAAALPYAPESPYWTAWCLQELVSEMDRTVAPDGANYEGSTGYHRLVAETFLRASAVAVALPLEARASAAGAVPDRAPPIRPVLRPLRGSETDLERREVFPGWYWDRLRRMAEFTADITGLHGRVPQFGDQDNGRFVKLAWPMRILKGVSTEEPRDHRHLIAAAGSLAGDSSGVARDPELEIEAAASAALLGLSRRDTKAAGSAAARYKEGDAASVWYPGGGVCILERGGFWAAFRCLGRMSGAPTGHLHDDQLSFEMARNGLGFIVDPGSGVYSADPTTRNLLRSRAAHSTVEVVSRGAASRKSPVPRNLFELADWTPAECVSVSATWFTGKHTQGGVTLTRTLTLERDGVVIEDALSAARLSVARFVLAPEVAVRVGPGQSEVSLETGGVTLRLKAHGQGQAVQVAEALCSEGYGSVCATRMVVINRTERVNRVEVTAP